MSHPHIDDVRDVLYHKPQCMAYPRMTRLGGDDRLTRCPNPATVWLVAPTDKAIMRECDDCAASVLAEYDAHQDALGGKWYTVPLRFEAAS